MGADDPPPWHPADSHHVLPPHCQWNSGTFPPTAQSHSQNLPYSRMSLPMVLLGVHSAIKEDLHCTTAELIYGTTLRLPGEFFTSSREPVDPFLHSKPPCNTYKLSPLPCSVFCVCESCPLHMHSCFHSGWRPLQQLYDGPYKVLKREAKHFIIGIKGRHDAVSLDRLKPAHSESEPPTPTHRKPCTPTPAPQIATPTLGPQEVTSSCRVTCSGRRVHWPQDFIPTGRGVLWRTLYQLCTQVQET